MILYGRSIAQIVEILVMMLSFLFLAWYLKSINLNLLHTTEVSHGA
jgi:hypothetical protein